MTDLVVLLPVVLMIALILTGIPIGYSFAIAGAIGLIWIMGPATAFSMLTSLFRSNTNAYLLSTVPMFILMAFYLEESRIVPHVFEAFHKWLHAIPGGMAMATTVANGAMAVLSGSSTASAVTMSAISVPEMKKYNYSDTLAIGTVSASGTFAIMFPPSVALIIYGILTGSSIRDLFLAGIVPGLVTLVGYMAVIFIWGMYSPASIGRGPENEITKRFSWSERFASLKPVWPAFIVVAFALGSLYAGIVTPTESGAMGAFGALLVGLLFADLNFSRMQSAHLEAVKLTGMIFIIFIGADAFGRFLTLTGTLDTLITSISQLPVSEMSVLVIILVVYIALGTIMDQLAILIITLPITFPIIIELGLHPVWFGIVLVKTVEIGLVTPPFGMNIFAATSPVDIDVGTAYRGAVTFLIVDLLVLGLLVLFPDIALWIPNQV